MSNPGRRHERPPRPPLLRLRAVPVQLQILRCLPSVLLRAVLAARRPRSLLLPSLHMRPRRAEGESLMTAQPVTQAIMRREKEDKLVGWLRHQEDDLAMAAASHLKPSTIIRVAQGALRRDDKLMAAAIANPQSLLHCLLDAARLGHEPGTDQYWLIPFGY